MNALLSSLVRPNSGLSVCGVNCASIQIKNKNSSYIIHSFKQQPYDDQYKVCMSVCVREQERMPASCKCYTRCSSKPCMYSHSEFTIHPPAAELHRIPTMQLFLKLITQKPVSQLRLFCSASAGTLTECTYWFSFSLQISCWNINDEKINQSNRQVCSARGLALLNTTQRSTSHNFVKSNKLIKLITCQSYIREKRR